MAARSGIETLLYLLDEAFRGGGIEESNESQALLTNLATVRAWPDGRRCRRGRLDRSATSPVTSARARSCTTTTRSVSGTLAVRDARGRALAPSGGSPDEIVIAWLAAVHARFVDHVAALDDDAELDRPRPTNWGELRPTRWIVAAMITHDAYHAGEINHLRSLLDGDDRWRFLQLGFG